MKVLLDEDVPEPLVPLLGLRVIRVGWLASAAILLSNMAYDLFRHLVLHPERNRDMKTTVKGTKWICAMLEGSLIRMFSEWGRVVGILERGEYRCLLMRFDWFCGVWGDGPRKEEMRNNQVRLALSVIVFAVLFQW